MGKELNASRAWTECSQFQQKILPAHVPQAQAAIVFLNPDFTMNFADRLKQLPSVSHLAALQLLDSQGQVLATLENKPGQAGSLAVYHALGALYGGSITPAAASLGMEWYAEHTADALAYPGKHPNIDRLVAWAQGTASYTVRLVAGGSHPVANQAQHLHNQGQ